MEKLIVIMEMTVLSSYTGLQAPGIIEGNRISEWRKR